MNQFLATWAVDPFDCTEERLKGVSVVLSALEQRNSGFTLEPIYVVEVDSDAETSSVSDLKTAAGRAFESVKRRVKIKNLREPRIFQADATRELNAVETVIRNAVGKGAELILVSTHAREGVSRALLGSFAEKLVLHSSVPVLVSNPLTVQQNPIEKILFATDYSEDNSKIIPAFIKFVKKIQGNVLLYSHLGSLEESFVEEKSKELKEKLEKEGIPVEVVADDQEELFVNGVDRAVQKHQVGMIAIAPRKGSLGATLLGSRARDLMRNLDRPVWVLHCANGEGK